jgi:hypothetical protein
MNSKHTPGPWLAANAQGGRIFKQWRIYSAGKSIAALTQPEGIGRAAEVDYANARLIAAAPDLLAALQELVLCPNKFRPDSVWEAARLAIAKATNG